MTTRRLFGALFLGGVLVTTGFVGPAAGAAPASTTTATALLGPNNRPCNGSNGTEPVGTATIQTAKTKDAVAADQRAVRVIVAADNVRARTTYNVYLATTVVEGSSVGCRMWSAGTVSSLANGKLGFSGAVTVPANLPSFQVYVGPSGPDNVGYTSAAINVSGM